MEYEDSPWERKEDDWPLIDHSIVCLGNSAIVDGVYVTVTDCPPCLQKSYPKIEDRECLSCDFYDPNICVFRKYASAYYDLHTIFAIYKEWVESENQKNEKRQHLLSALLTEMRAHGRPLHYTVIAEILKDRHPHLKVTRKKVYLFLARNPQYFKKVSQGVYQCLC